MAIILLLTSIVSQDLRYVVLSFDDGYYAIYSTAYPLLKQFGFKITLGIIANTLRSDKRVNFSPYSYLRVYEIKEMIDSLDIEIASHSYSHKDLTKIIKEEELEREICHSKAVLESIFDREVISFIYPYGRYNQKVIKFLFKNGYRLARGTEEKEVNFLTSPFSLGVKEVRKQTSLEEIKNYVLSKKYTILLFHRIVDNPVYFTDYSKLNFASLLTWLKDNNIKVVTLKELSQIWWGSFFAKNFPKKGLFQKVDLDIIRAFNTP